MEKKLIQVLETICALLLVVLVFSVAFQIAAREILGIAATWTTYIGRITFTAIVFLGLPICISEGSQMVITMVKDMVYNNKIVTLIFDVVGDLVSYFFIITLIYGSLNRTIEDWNSVIPTLEWMSLGYTYLIMFIGSLCMLLAQVLHTKKYIQAYKAKEDK